MRHEARRHWRMMVILSIMASALCGCENAVTVGTFAPDRQEKQLLAGDPNALLTNATIEITTLNDNKDHDTKLDLRVVRVGGQQAAYRAVHEDQEFPDGSLKVFDVPPSGVQMRRADIVGSWVQFNISPNGHDTWKFRFKATLRFTDGTTYERSFGNTGLSHDVRQGNYPL